ncbi:PAS domain-containing hybrid sensor histidine kinase/response regulator [Desulfogranum japonicum]|uniref:PAS domain-containing hybrid sensor histidine kinase/response regulator n=1 Tax=Desulfogranum japonicum TaxID=231447 RepID=UPI00041380FE|nr:PAS domain-containing sensor histidine kinase [Desulfogranum japonicum]
MRQSGYPEKFEKLREQAENLLRLHLPANSTTPTDLSEIIHELNVHQVELEIQNRELQRSQYEYAQLHKEFSALYEFAPFGYVTVNAKQIISRANLAAVQLLGGSRNQIQRSGFTNYIDDDHNVLAFTRARLRAVETGEKQSVEVRLKHKPDAPRWVRLDIEAKTADVETPTGLRITLVDITPQKQAAKKHLQAKQEWEKTFDAINDVITIQDTEMRIVRANKAAYETFQIDPEALGGRFCYEIFRERDTPCPDCPVVKTIGDAKSHNANILYKNLDKTFHVSSAPVLDSNGHIKRIVHIAKDITSQKKVEKKLFQTSKMEAIGTLAGGVAHDFNNILTVIMGYSELIKYAIPPDQKRTNGYIDYVISASTRAKELIQQILTFSRTGNEKKAPFNLSEVIIEGLNLLHASVPSTVVLCEEIDVDAGYIMGDETKIQQVLINLCINAVQAMADEKGTLTIKLKQVMLTKKELPDQENFFPGPFIELSVSDTGQGIDPKIIEKIFDPYFTTKKFGQGSGLGLSLVHGVVLSSGGFIKVKSELGSGTTFEIFFPVIQMQTKPIAEQIDKEEQVAGSSECILVVDDEKIIVDLYKMVLETQGYTVIGHCNSEKALDEIRRSPDRFALVITDQTMPHLSGVDFSKKILELRPEIPIILCTGYSNMVSKDTATEIGITDFLMKPIRAKVLTHTVQEILNKRKA